MSPPPFERARETAIAQRLRVKDMVLNCLVQGEGTPILLLHGWPQTNHAWRFVRPALADQFTVVAPDLPGFGASSKPLTGYDKRSIASHLRDLMHALDHTRFHVVGHDLGGQVAYALAAQWPEEVLSLAFVEAGVPGLGDKLDAANPFKGGSWHFGFNMVPDLPEALVAGREHMFVKFLLLRDKIGVFNSDAISDIDLAVYADALAQPGALRGSFAHYRALPQDMDDNRAWVAEKRLRMPVLVVGGRYGIGLSWVDTVEAAAERVQTCLVDSAGHYLPEEQPEALVAALRKLWN